MKKRGMRKVLFTIACVMLFAIAGGRQVFAQGGKSDITGNAESGFCIRDCKRKSCMGRK